MKIRTRFSDLALNKPIVKFTKPSLTEQHHKESCDINNVIRRYDATGVLDHVNHRPAMFDDLSILPEDYLQAHELSQTAERSFMSLPAATRERFKHDPSELLLFLSKTENRDEAVRLGLISPPAAPAEQPEQQG